MTTPTFAHRLTLLCTSAIFAVLSAAGVSIYAGVAHGERVHLDATLASIARAEVASASDGHAGTVHVHEENGLGSEPLLDGGYVKYAQIEDERDRVVAQTKNLEGLPPLGVDRLEEARGRSGHVSFANIALGTEPLRCIYYPFTDKQGRSLLAVIAISRRPMEQYLGTLMQILLVVLTLGTIIAGVMMHWMARRITRPLREIASAAHAVRDSNINARIPQVAQDRELQEVTLVLNQMLERLELSFQRQQELLNLQQRFVADASHELRSPLSNLRTTVEITLRRPRSIEDYQATLETSLAEIGRLSRLVEDLLTLSRADAKQLRWSRTECDLRDIIRGSVAAHTARANELGVKISIAETSASEASEVPVIEGDADRLRQVVDNLLDNALRYAPAGSGVHISLDQEKRAAGAGGNQEWAIVRIADEGPGLTADEQSAIFERFYRADSSRARSSGGAGLGLAIVKAIVEGHGGTITVRSEKGKGAIFTIHLKRSSDS